MYERLTSTFIGFMITVSGKPLSSLAFGAADIHHKGTLLREFMKNHISYECHLLQYLLRYIGRIRSRKPHLLTASLSA